MHSKDLQELRMLIRHYIIEAKKKIKKPTLITEPEHPEGETKKEFSAGGVAGGLHSFAGWYRRKCGCPEFHGCDPWSEHAEHFGAGPFAGGRPGGDGWSVTWVVDDGSCRPFRLVAG